MLKNNGLTLVELMIGMGVFILGLVFVAEFMVSNMKYNKILLEKSENSEFVFYSSKLVSHNFTMLNHLFMDPDKLLYTDKKLNSSQYGDFKVSGLTQMPDHKKSIVYTHNGVDYYSNSSLLGAVAIDKNGLSIERGDVDLIFSRCVDKKDVATSSDHLVMLNLINVKSRFPVKVLEGDKDRIKCCMLSAGSLSCVDAEKETLVPHIFWFKIRKDGTTSYRYYPSEKENSLGTGFFYYLDKSSKSISQLRMDYFSFFDPCKSSFGTCDPGLKTNTNLSDFPMVQHSYESTLSYPIKTSRPFSIQ